MTWLTDVRAHAACLLQELFETCGPLVKHGVFYDLRCSGQACCKLALLL
jgi:hypothetical protein